MLGVGDALQVTVVGRVAVDAVVGAQIEPAVLVGRERMDGSHRRCLGLHFGGPMVLVQAQQTGVVGQPQVVVGLHDADRILLELIAADVVAAQILSVAAEHHKLAR